MRTSGRPPRTRWWRHRAADTAVAGSDILPRRSGQPGEPKLLRSNVVEANREESERSALLERSGLQVRLANATLDPDTAVLLAAEVLASRR